MNLLIFALACASLLATPGPTNTLLATAGAEAGWRPARHLLIAELAGYLLAVTILRAVLGPLIAAQPGFALALQGAVVIYVFHLAVALWRRGRRGAATGRSITFRRVMLTTLLNPKGVIFAFTLLPAAADGMLTELLVLSAEIVAIGFGWILLGDAFHGSLRNPAHAKIGYRLSAGMLTCLASVVAVRAIVAL
ncbi:conserved membrane hypothetical protein [Hyphomicrobiales bacterium]|nr:conserved membrane hypothetical protein [Hyphomicrobiales bacterium]CAH1698584.1 conserved membrane hypothetical protein [Hyphomicrobiales bacterium]CAI0342231.1 conserved membrane hypothetical protein [Hyphomicrobiales bacterium]